MFLGWRIFALIETGRGSVMQRWRWLCVGANGESREADRGFATVLACRADAYKHGLNPYAPVQVVPLTCPLDSLGASSTLGGSTWRHTYSSPQVTEAVPPRSVQKLAALSSADGVESER